MKVYFIYKYIKKLHLFSSSFCVKEATQRFQTEVLSFRCTPELEHELNLQFTKCKHHIVAFSVTSFITQGDPHNWTWPDPTRVWTRPVSDSEATFTLTQVPVRVWVSRHGFARLHYIVNSVTLRERYITCAIIMTYSYWRQIFPFLLFSWRKKTNC